jgi:hypothetical protein
MIRLVCVWMLRSLLTVFEDGTECL